MTSKIRAIDYNCYGVGVLNLPLENSKQCVCVSELSDPKSGFSMRTECEKSGLSMQIEMLKLSARGILCRKGYLCISGHTAVVELLEGHSFSLGQIQDSQILFCPFAAASGFWSLQFTHLTIWSQQVLQYNTSAIRC